MPTPASFIFLGSPPIGPIALRTLEAAHYAPKLAISDTSLSDNDLVQLVEKHQAGFILVVGYGKILRKKVIDSVAGQVINIHPSLLPQYRGPAPVIQTILDAPRETGVSIIEIDQKMDHGPLLAQESYPLSDRETPDELYQILISQGTRLFLDVIDDYLNGTLDLAPQHDGSATYTHFITKEDGELDFSVPARQLERQVRAYQGWPGSWFIWNNKRLIVKQAHVENNTLVIDLIQPEGKQKMTLAAFCAGQRLTLSDFYQQGGLHYGQ